MTWAQAIGLSLLMCGACMWGATSLAWAPFVAAPCSVALIAIMFKGIGDS